MPQNGNTYEMLPFMFNDDEDEEGSPRHDKKQLDKSLIKHLRYVRRTHIKQSEREQVAIKNSFKIGNLTGHKISNPAKSPEKDLDTRFRDIVNEAKYKSLLRVM